MVEDLKHAITGGSGSLLHSQANDHRVTIYYRRHRHFSGPTIIAIIANQVKIVLKLKAIFFIVLQHAVFVIFLLIF